MTRFLMYHRKKLLRGEAQKGLMPDFFMRTRKKLGGGGGGYTQIFGVYSKNVSASVGGVGGNYAQFFHAY